eukprot:TRINITY_DN17526_c0_g1_i2.p2 TRINITY_DN17526_c0_g1~~TRINITY_DN17526_c0_g1_i2.p2  ORF type:complete len:257 (+),score=109.68 TRINITY_DN17526_c0_g1_i2:79-771(+)
MPGRKPICAIDGPVGAGKSSVSKEVARRLGYGFVDTGAIYRCIALKSTVDGVDPGDEAGLKALADCVQIRFNMTQEGINQVFLGDREVTTDIRKEEVSMAASKTSKVPAVRESLLGLQRKLGESGGIVMEGRDIGTVIFPQAEVKIYLTADDKVRAKRRFDELVGKGEKPDFDQVLADLKERDAADMKREVAPLKQADDATLVDSTGMSQDEVVSRIVQLVQEAEKKMAS